MHKTVFFLPLFFSISMHAMDDSPGKSIQSLNDKASLIENVPSQLQQWFLDIKQGRETEPIPPVDGRVSLLKQALAKKELANDVDETFLSTIATNLVHLTRWDAQRICVKATRIFREENKESRVIILSKQHIEKALEELEKASCEMQLNFDECE
jgi:hypothetical protein